MLKSKYEKWENINPYFPSEQRKFLDWELLEEYENNIFWKSDIPIVKHKNKVKCSLSTYAMLEPPDNYVKTSLLFYTYPLNKYDLLLAKLEYLKLNKILISNRLPFWYGFNSDDSWAKNTSMIYDYENNLFKLSSYSEKNKSLKNHLEIIYNEDGTIKKATIKKLLKQGHAISIFKTYKSGFELYKTTYGGEIKYRRKI